MNSIILKSDKNEVIISFEEFKKNWNIEDRFLEIKVKIGIPYLLNFENHFTILNEENIDLVAEIEKQLNLNAVYENNVMLVIGETKNKSNIVENIILQGFRDLKRYEENEFVLLNHLKEYLVKYNIDCYFKSIFQLSKDGCSVEFNSYSHWVLYLKDFKLYIDLDGIYSHDDYIKKIATRYKHSIDLVGFTSTEPAMPLNIKYEHLMKWFEFCNLNNLMLEDEQFRKNFKICDITNIKNIEEECPF